MVGVADLFACGLRMERLIVGATLAFDALVEVGVHRRHRPYQLQRCYYLEDLSLTAVRSIAHGLGLI